MAGAPTRNPEIGGLRISALVLGRDGQLAGRYDKRHVDPASGPTGSVPGRGLQPDPCRLAARAGDLLGRQLSEHARAAALDGCQAYLVGAMFARRGARRRATICRPGPGQRQLPGGGQPHRPSGPFHGCGRSAVWDPDGGLVADAGLDDDPGLAVARLDPEVLARAHPGTWSWPTLLHAPVHPRGAVSLD